MNLRNPRRFSYALVATAALVSTATAQSLDSRSAVPLAASAPTAVPALVPFSGILADPNGKPVSSETSITFLIFKDQQGGEPLFAETQAVTPDAGGHYKVQLGATLPNGLPADLFASGEARWLEVQAAGQAPQPRMLMASVPYALKAADSATLGGLPASAFVLAGSKAAAAAIAEVATSAATAGTTVTTTGGVSGYLPEFSGASTIVDSPLFVSGASVGIGKVTPGATLDVNGSILAENGLTADGASTFNGPALFSPTETATASKGGSSQSIQLESSAYDSTTASVVNPRFQLQAEPAGNNTSAPTATLNLLSSTNSNPLAETGLSFNANGTINFAKGQTFPGAGGAITGVTAGTGLTGGGTSGAVSLNVNESVVAFQSDLSSAEKTLNASISAAQSAAISSSESYANETFLSQSGGTIAGNLVVQGPTSESQSAGNYFTVTGGDGVFNAGAVGQGVGLSAGHGSDSLSGPNPGDGGSISLTSGRGGYGQLNNGGNAGSIVLTLGQPGGGGAVGRVGHVFIDGDDTTAERGVPSQLQIRGASNSSKQLLIGYYADTGGDDNGWGSIQATNEGVVNTPLLLNPYGGGVGIQTTNVTNTLTIGQGQGVAIADGWATYSSRRFKTDIRTLPDALEKVEKLRGVSYTLKATGKHEIGVIAEEVGKVVPEVVTYEKNGVDAQSVDYTRLTALLIEATKEQQALIQQQQKRIEAQQAQIARLASQMRTVQAVLNDSGHAAAPARTAAQLTMH